MPSSQVSLDSLDEEPSRLWAKTRGGSLRQSLCFYSSTGVQLLHLVEANGPHSHVTTIWSNVDKVKCDFSALSRNIYKSRDSPASKTGRPPRFHIVERNAQNAQNMEIADKPVRSEAYECP